jgi:hypothetical protein
MEKYTYEILETGLGDKVLLRSDGVFIPMVDGNADYQRYLNPEAEQSTPIVIDETSTK